MSRIAHFKDNSADIETAGIFMTFSNGQLYQIALLRILKATFYNSITPSMHQLQLLVPGGFLYVSVGVELAVTLLQNLLRGNAYAGGAIYIVRKFENYNQTGSTFTDNYSETTGGSIYLIKL